MTIVVVGGSGVLGHHVVDLLVSQGQSVRVLVRDAGRARQLLGEVADRVEVVAGDVRDPATLGPALAGARVVISAMHGFLGGRGAGPDEVDRLGNAHLADAAAAAGADVVLVSVLGAAAASPSDLFRAKHAAEQQLRASGARWTIVRAPAFLETWLDILTQTAGASGRPVIFGRGETPLRFVSAADVAGIVARAATDDAMRGQVVEMPGMVLTMVELARELQAARGWSGAPRHVPRAALRMVSALAGPVSPAFARKNRTALAMDTGGLSGAEPATDDTAQPTRTLSEVLAGL